MKFHSSNQGISPIKNPPKEHLKWFQRMAKRAAVIDSLLTYLDELTVDPNHCRIMVPNDIQLQRHLLLAYHESPIEIRRGLEATYEALSHDFYWPNVAKHVRNSCIKFRSADPKRGPMQIRIFDCPFDTIA